ncbi:DUF4013 domain-containing protein [Methanobacterium sp.]|jgi:hypothetical protein|uniref:DUF4013 domain-containing protein n=1 Tax=Methanobacterium sp. TaxID=2164 RepID=UPI0031591935
MDVGEIIKDSLKYPLSNWKEFLVLGVFIAFSGMSNLSVLVGVKDSALIGFLGIIGFLSIALIFGYSFRIIKSSLAGVKRLPEFNDWPEMFVDGVKFMVVNFVYLIPVILIIIFVYYSGSDIGSIPTLNLVLWLYVWFPYLFLLIALLYLIIIIPVILMAVANMIDNDGKLSAAFKFKEIFNNVSKLTEDTLTGSKLVFYNSLVSIIIGFFIFDEIIDRISSIRWTKLIIWYMATGIISLTLIFIGYTLTNITSILILHGLDLYSISNYNILMILILSLVLLPYLFIFLSRSAALIYNYAIKSYLLNENCMRNYQFHQDNLLNSGDANEKQLEKFKITNINDSSSKKGKYIGLVVGLLVLVVLAHNFVNFNDNSMDMSIKTYSGNGISFNYSADWRLFQDTTTDTTSSIAVFKYDVTNGPGLRLYIMPTNESTQDVINNWRNFIVSNGTIISNGTLKIDGNIAYQVTGIADINGSNKNMRYEGISFVKNGKMYSFLLQAPDSDFDKEEQNFNIILNSFKAQ